MNLCNMYNNTIYKHRYKHHPPASTFPSLFISPFVPCVSSFPPSSFPFTLLFVRKCKRKRKRIIIRQQATKFNLPGSPISLCALHFAGSGCGCRWHNPGWSPQFSSLAGP